VGLWDRYGGSMPSGWIRYVLERFDFDFELVYAPELDAGNLRASYDVLIFPDGAIPAAGGGRGGRGGGRGGAGGDRDLEGIPPEYHDRVGSVTADETVPEILDFLRQGGTVVTIGSSVALAEHAGLPVDDHLVGPDGRELGQGEFFIPGSLLEVDLEHGSPALHGLGETVDVMFSRSPVLSVPEGTPGLTVLGRYATAAPLRSGWAWGQEHLDGGAALVEADVGEGKLFLFTPEVTFRAQPHGTFPLVFNAILYGPARDVAAATDAGGG